MVARRFIVINFTAAGTERNHVAVGQDSALRKILQLTKQLWRPPPETANTGRRTTRRTANSGSEATRPPQPPRQTRRAAAVKAAAAIAANAAAEGPAPEARAAAATENAAPTDADGSPDDQAGKHPAVGQRDKEGPAEEDDAADEEHEPQASRGRRAKGPAPSRDSGNQAAAGDVIAEAGENKMPSPGPQRAGTRAAKSATAATPAQRKRTATSAPCTTRRMAAVERYWIAVDMICTVQCADGLCKWVLCISYNGDLPYSTYGEGNLQALAQKAPCK